MKPVAGSRSTASQPVERIGEAVVGARRAVQSSRGSRGALEEDAPVRGRHHLVAPRPCTTRTRLDARRAPRPASRADLGDQRRARRGDVGGSACGQLGEARGRVPGHDRQRRGGARGRDPERDEAAEARAEQPEAAVEAPGARPGGRARPRGRRCARRWWRRGRARPTRRCRGSRSARAPGRPRAARGRAAGTCRCPWRRPCRDRRPRRAPGDRRRQVQHAEPRRAADDLDAEALARSRPDEVEEPAGVDGELVHRLVDRQPLDLGHFFGHPRDQPRPGR